MTTRISESMLPVVHEAIDRLFVADESVSDTERIRIRRTARTTIEPAERLLSDLGMTLAEAIAEKGNFVCHVRKHVLPFSSFVNGRLSVVTRHSKNPNIRFEERECQRCQTIVLTPHLLNNWRAIVKGGSKYSLSDSYKKTAGLSYEEYCTILAAIEFVSELPIYRGQLADNVAELRTS